MNDELKEIAFILRLLLRRIENLRLDMSDDHAVKMSIMKITCMVFQLSDLIEKIEDDN